MLALAELLHQDGNARLPAAALARPPVTTPAARQAGRQLGQPQPAVRQRPHQRRDLTGRGRRGVVVALLPGQRQPDLSRG